MRHCTRHLIALALVAVMSPRAQAVDLVDVWRAALGHDAELAAARAARDAGEARRTQADTLWRPAVVLDAGAGIATNETSVQGARFSAPGFGQTTGVAFDTSVTNGTSGRVAVALRQPLISRGREVQQRQLEISADIAETQMAGGAAVPDLARRRERCRSGGLPRCHSGGDPQSSRTANHPSAKPSGAASHGVRKRCTTWLERLPIEDRRTTSTSGSAAGARANVQ